MTVQTFSTLDTQMALDLFRSEHYLYVYSTALELTASPSAAQAIAAQVFENAAIRFAHKPVPANCDMYLAAQTHLIYAQQVLPAAEAPQVTPRAAATPQAAPAAHTMPGVPHRRVRTAAYVNTNKQQQATAFSAPTQPASADAAGAGTHAPPAAAQPAPQPVSYMAQATPPQAFPTVQPAPAAQYASAGQAVATAQTVPMVAWMPLGQGISFMQITSAGQAMPVIQAIPVTQVPAYPYGYQPTQAAAMPTATVAAAPQVYAAAENPAAAQEPAQTQPTVPENGSNAADAQPPAEETDRRSASPKAGAACDAIYNQDDTEYWTPDGEVCEMAAPEPEISSSWEEEVRDKPSVVLSLINGLLMLLSLASIGFLLFELNILPKQF